MAQMIECLSNKHDVYSTAKNKTKQKKKQAMPVIPALGDRDQEDSRLARVKS
jgi:hypothetical protein